MQWFRHDIGAFKDEQIQALRIDCGGAAVDAYYAILELIYEGETDLVMRRNQAETKSVLHWLCLGWAGFRQYVEAMAEAGLLGVSVTDDGEPSETLTISSERATEFIDDYHAKAETARQNGRKGGRPKKGNQGKTQSVFDRNPEETQSKANKEIRNKNIEKEVSNDTSKKNDPAVETAAGEIVAYLNARIGTHYKPRSKGTLKHVSARLREGYTVDDFKTVIDKKCADWRNDPRMAPYLRPETLFGPKFEGYLNEIDIRGGVADGRYDKYR